MKIAILTLKLHTNYGGILQAWALQTVLERMGHEVDILNTPEFYPVTEWRNIPKRIIKKLLGRDEVVFRELRYKREASIVNKDVWAFRNKYIHERILNSLNEINEYEYDCFVVGSDQVWRPKYFKKQWQTGIDKAYLSFTNGWNVKRIAYAASFGVDEWEYTEEETEKCKQALSAFDVVSVREDSGISLVKNHLHHDVSVVLDPTMFLLKEDYIKLIEDSKTPKSNGTLLAYILNGNKEKTNFINKVAKEKKLVPFSVNNSFTKKTAPIEERVLPSVEQWLRGFYDAEFVITDSFHACVFSIIFGKPFIVLGNAERGMSRFSSLLGMFDMKENLITSFDDYHAYIKYSTSNKTADILHELRSKSYNELRKCNNH